MRTYFGVLALAAVATTAGAQGGGMPGMQDATKNTKQVGPLPAGWMGRTDRANLKLEDANFATMGSGLHVTTGPAVILWNPANTASGTYTISAAFGVRSVPDHDYYGLIWGGSDLGGDKVSYGYFLVGGDGTFIVKHRYGPGQGGRGGNPPADVHTVIDKTPHDAIRKAMKDGQPANMGSASNALEVRVAADSVRFIVNGTQVGAADARSPMVPTSGIFGLRVNHNIDTHVGSFGKK